MITKMDKDKLIEEMLKDMGDRNNTIDLNAYGRVLIDMYDRLVKNCSIPVVSDCFVYDSILLRRIGNEIEFQSDSYEEGLSELPKDEIPSLIKWLQAQYNR